MKGANDELYGSDYAEKGYEMFGQTLPADTVKALQRYVADRVYPGHFLAAALSNDFLETWMRGEQEHLDSFAALGSYIYHEMPFDSFGSREKVLAWLEGEGDE